MTRPATAPLAWVRQRAADASPGLDWVDLSLDPTRERFSQGPDGFHPVAYTRFLPTAVVEAAKAARDKGEPTLLEGIQLVFAEQEWMIETRALLWAPDSPAPALLRHIVEAHGIDAGLHRADPARLQRLAERLPAWYARRGEAGAALELLRSALDDAPAEHIAPPDRLPDEVFACRSAEWWAARGAGRAQIELQIQGGWMRFQPHQGPQVGLRREDLLIAWTPGQPLHRGLLRLLPVWCCHRVTVAQETPA